MLNSLTPSLIARLQQLTAREPGLYDAASQLHTLDEIGALVMAAAQQHGIAISADEVAEALRSFAANGRGPGAGQSGQSSDVSATAVGHSGQGSDMLRPATGGGLRP